MTKHEFIPVEKEVGHPYSAGLTIAQMVYLASQVGVIVYGVQSWTRRLMPFPFGSLNSIFQHK